MLVGDRDRIVTAVATGELDLGLVDGFAAPSDPLRLPDPGGPGRSGWPSRLPVDGSQSRWYSWPISLSGSVALAGGGCSVRIVTEMSAKE